MTEQICQLGFYCPYHRYNDEGDGMCIYPHVFITENEDDETFGLVEEMDCPLVALDSELDHWLMDRVME